MSFIWPGLLFTLLVVPLSIALYIRTQQRRRQVAMQFGTLGLVRENAGHGPGRRRPIPPVIFLTGLTILVISLARPQASVSLPRIEGTVILAFDMSASMAADDLKP